MKFLKKYFSDRQLGKKKSSGDGWSKKKKILVGIIAFVIVIAIAGALMSGGEEKTSSTEGDTEQINYEHEYESDWVTVNYTNDISADEAEGTAILLGGRTPNPEAQEQMFGKMGLEVWIHKENTKVVVSIETAYDSEHEITSTAETVYEGVIGEDGTIHNQVFEGELEIRLLNPDEDIIRSLKWSPKSGEDETGAEEVEMNVLNVEERSKEKLDMSPTEGNIFLYIQVEIKNNKEDKNIDINPNEGFVSYRLETDAGKVYDRHVEEVNAPAELTPGAQDSFWLSFELPESEAGTTLICELLGPEEKTYTENLSSYSSDSSSSNQETENVESADFQVSNLTLHPEEITVVEQTTVSIDVKNTGEGKGTYDAVLEVGERQKSQEVSLEPNETRTVDFSVGMDDGGEYKVGIDGLFENLWVSEFEIIEVGTTDYINPDTNEENPPKQVFAKGDTIYYYAVWRQYTDSFRYWDFFSLSRPGTDPSKGEQLTEGSGTIDFREAITWNTLPTDQDTETGEYLLRFNLVQFDKETGEQIEAKAENTTFEVIENSSQNSGNSEDETTTWELTTSVQPSEAGGITPSSGTFEDGTEVTLNATASKDYKFSHWSGHVSGESSEITITMDSDKQVVANFTEKKTNPFTGGSGTKDDPYKISNEDQLQAINDYLESNFVLINDINASETKNWNNGKGFDPIGYYDGTQNYFTGTFNGQGYTITNLYINRPESKAGFFGYIGKEGVVKDIGLEDENITGKYSVGGLAGVNVGEVLNSYSTGFVTGEQNVGGLVGYNNPAGLVSNSHSESKVVADSRPKSVGGLVGQNDKGTVSKSYAIGTVHSLPYGSEYTGGLVGNNSGIVSKSFAISSVKGGYEVGGLVGRNSGSVSKSYARGKIEGRWDTAGLVGRNYGSVSNSYAAVSAETDGVWGLIGENTEASVSHSFWDVEVAGQDRSHGGTGKTTEEMKTKSTFTNAGWDFEDVWNIESGVNDGYPFLRDLQ
ncbi:hypothetical protein AKJ51_03005 [candidate division MSBL1 archaeon SCGC-AAA382A20]|uniref:Bacterial repeat domain-containing protein n=1 Tax=candidate division MSBL1 archaeon SCGC-AAA382A20 TaxID=1698280 RepID=A0A133VJZ9_9EURY|nr:hypothetical protein AKJ51_03005 [candidate division MSBL1 archaeon SCGC-AAA382A20]